MMALQSVTVTPHWLYRLFSVTKSMKYGWEMYGDNKNIGTINGKKEVEFDIFINTPKWELFCT